MTKAPNSLSSAAQERRETRVLLWIAGLTVAVVIAAVVGFNTVGRSLFNSLDTAAPAADTASSHPASAALASTVQASARSAPPKAGVNSPSPELMKSQISAAGTSMQPASGAPANGFKPPDAEAIPDGPFGDAVRRGEQIFLHTKVNAPQFVGNSLNCVNCHLDAGRKADSAPLWGAYSMYPAYRGKTKHVDTFAERLRGCFTYSMDGKAPPFGDDVLVSLEAYAYWMSKGAPIGEKLPGSGYPRLPEPKQQPDGVRGHAVYQAQCALCHGAEGLGTRAGDEQIFPPLWGPQSYNWGAGMHSVSNASAFIKSNMPLGKGGTLSDQEAWDVAWYINSHERPQDPRFTGDVAATRAKFHDDKYSLYGTTVNGKLLGAQAY